MVYGQESNLNLLISDLTLYRLCHHATVYKIVHLCQLLRTLLFYYAHSVQDVPKIKFLNLKLMFLNLKLMFTTTFCTGCAKN